MSQKYNVCVIEDEPLMREYLACNLTRINPDFYVSATASNGIDAIDLLCGHDFDLIISDIRMPGLSGLEIVGKIRNEEDNTPVILLTGYDDFSYAKTAIKLGISDYLLKPLNDDELRESLNKVKEYIERTRHSITIPDELSPDVLAHIIAEKFHEQNSEDSQVVNRAVAYISEHFCEGISQSDVATAIGVSPAYLSGLFREGTGEPYSEFIKRLRMTKAAALLRSQPDMTINVIAEQVGYFSDKHFISVFKKYFSCTPSEFRKS